MPANHVLGMQYQGVELSMKSKMDQFMDVFREFTAHINVPEYGFDNEGNCLFGFGDGLEVNLHLDENAEELTIFAQVTELDKDEDLSEVLELMAQGSYFWMATRGFTLSMDSGSYRIIMAGRQDVSYFTDAEFLEEYIVAFCDVVREWQSLAEAEKLPDIPIITPPMRKYIAEKDLEELEENNPFFLQLVSRGKIWV